MLNLSDKAPKYLVGQYQSVATVTFSACWGLLMMMLTVPFSDSTWFRLDISNNFTYTILFFATTIVLVSLSRRIMFLRYARRDVNMSLLTYCVWIALEILFICLFYSLFTIVGSRAGLIESVERPFELVFFGSLAYGIVCIGVPTTLAGMYFAINERDNTIRVMNYGNVVSDEVLPAHQEKKITLFDNNGVLKLSVTSSNLYYIESDDNYVRVWYCNREGELKQYMLRCRLKTIEESFLDTNLMRIHRKYIVNMDMVKVLHYEKDGYELDLDREEIPPLQISKSYEAAVLAKFNSQRA